MQNLYEIEVKTIDGDIQRMQVFSDKTLLIVNVASKCGFTKQYTELEDLYQRYKEKGFVILGFPCNQFGEQEPGNEAEIKQFCSSKYNVTFPLFAKIKVNGADAHPLYKHLTSAKQGVLGTKNIKWNFTKFLIDKNGNVCERFAPQTSINKIEKAMARLI